ncbi:carbohydrate ABC transporter permease [uncultured Neglectibacter sp.]|uniref:carbohydrate ABC transporter permease n=1 Tax=uncultured Neglectibacter sp. TaxID=1924108 RepID=UPI0034DFC5E2
MSMGIKKKQKLMLGVGTAFALLVSIVSLAPFAYVLFCSFFREDAGFSLLSYYDVFLGSAQYLNRFWVSLGICLCIALGQLLVSILAGYGFAKIKFPGSDLLFFCTMIIMLLPIQVTLVPNYIMLDNLKLLNTYAALILPAVFAPLGTFILTQSFRSIPDSIIDAAMLDGCGIPRILVSIASPMNKSGLVCTLLLSFLDGWNMVEQPIAYLKDFESYPLSVALAYAPPADPSIQLVCCVLAAFPPLFLFTCFNKELVEGITLAEVK